MITFNAWMEEEDPGCKGIIRCGEMEDDIHIEWEITLQMLGMYETEYFRYIHLWHRDVSKL